MSHTERVVENLNRALGDLLDRDPKVYLLGEDITDPYGGAFKVTHGLSTRHPDRVLGTPISEGGLVGVAGGLALTGQTAIAEIMFSDFVTLAFDQIVNFASKAVTMFGRVVPIRLVIRCPTGGRRGYGPTHSQSLQKHFLGVPNLVLFELSPFHDAGDIFAAILARGRPTILFEDKVLYTERTHRDGRVDDLFGFDLLGPQSVARARVEDVGAPDCVLVCPGGLAGRALAAARTLLLVDEIVTEVLVPAQLYPLDVEPLLPVLAAAQQVVVVEDSTAGGTWGAGIAHDVHTRLWGRLRAPVRQLHARDAVVPSTAHLEHEVLVQDEDIRHMVKDYLRRGIDRG
ncbi:MAG: alpha-ketoacid dehydrogenase subunit beta [Actinobacteria bacterium]|nr:alpha-ketoacid dehydrogenase subunit beta [Actinomycetota bacterium]